MIRTFTAAEYAAYLQALPVERLQRPLFTNASVNRKRAAEVLKAGKTPQQVAAYWPEVFALVDGKLAQLYDYRFLVTETDEVPTYETSRTITDESVSAWLRELAVCRHCDRRIVRTRGAVWRTVIGDARYCDGRSGAKWSRHQPQR